MRLGLFGLHCKSTKLGKVETDSLAFRGGIYNLRHFRSPKRWRLRCVRPPCMYMSKKSLSAFLSRAL